MKKILVTGGAGYVGCRLVPKLLEKGYHVIVYDALYFGQDGLPKSSHLDIVKGDIRDNIHFHKSCKSVDTIIHLACISNDPSFELDPSLSKSINYDCFEPLVLAAKTAGVKRFIYASTSSVYGVSDAPQVTEEHPLVPLTDYNRYKGLTEPLLLKHLDDNYEGVIIRPATVCGYSPRMRLDLSVNILTNLAYNNREITVFGGEQRRPNVHIDDLAELYVDLIETPKELIQGQIFNFGNENLSIRDLALKVKTIVEEKFPEKAPITIKTSPSNDLRSYHISSDKIFRVLSKAPKRSVEQAIIDLCQAFKRGDLPHSLTDEKYSNIKTMKNTYQEQAQTL